MPIQKEENESSNEEYEDEEYEEMSENDFGFVIDETGELKSVIFPEYLMEEPPRQVKKILKIFGIKDIHDIIVDKTIH